MAGPTGLKTDKGFGTWLIPIIMLGTLGSVALMSLVAFVCVYLCRPRRTTDQEPVMTYETYRTPTTTYRGPSADAPVDPTIGRLVTHSRSLHVPRNQLINARRLRPQVSSPELRNASHPPPYAYQVAPSPIPYRSPRPHGQVYFDEIVIPGHEHQIPQQPRQLSSPPLDLPAQPTNCFSVSSPSSYSSTRMSAEEPSYAEVFSLPSTPSNFSRESFTRVRTPSWIDFPEPKNLNSADSVSYLAPSNHDDLFVVSPVPDHYEAEKPPPARLRSRSETGGRARRSWQGNRRLIIVDNNLVGGDSEALPDPVEVHTLSRVEVSRLARGKLARREARPVATKRPAREEQVKETSETQIEAPPPVGTKKERDAIFKVICPDTGDLWKIPVIPGETLDKFARRVKQRTGGDVILFMDDEVLASERDWKAVEGGGRIVARLIC